MNPITLKYLLKAITQAKPLGRLKFRSLRTLRKGKAEGILIGGNLSLITSTIGTPYEVDTENKILFIEDVGEDLENIDNYLMHLKLAGKFKKIKGIIFGRMLYCSDKLGRRYTIRNVLDDILSDIDVPIMYGFPSGHRKPGDINITLPLGVKAALDATRQALTIVEPAVI